MSRSRTPKCNHSLNANRNYENSAKHENRCERCERSFGQGNGCGTRATARRSRGSGDLAHARDHHCAGPGPVWGLQPARKPCGGLCGSRSSAHHPGPGTRKARGAERRCNRRGREGARQEEEPALGASSWRGEQHLIATAPTWTILRMNYYAEGLVQQARASLDQGVLTGLAENRVAFVARGDVAAAAAGILIGDGHAGAIYNATGPERLSGAERAALIAEITGRPLAFLTITDEQLRAGLTQAGLPVEVVNIAISIQASCAAGAFDIVTGDVERLGGRPPKPLRDVLAGALDPRAASETSDAA